MKAINAIRVFAIALLITAFLSFFYILIGPGFEISVIQSWGAVARDTTEIKTVIAVNNPNPLPRSIIRIQFELYINDLKICEETSDESIEVKPLGKTEISFTNFLNNSRITELWAAYLSKDNNFEVGFIGNITFRSMIREIICPIGYNTTTHTNLLELLNLQPRNITAGPSSLISKTLALSWGEVTSAQTEINNEVVIYNSNEHSVTIKTINYTIEMNGVKMGEDTIHKSMVLETEKDNNISFTTILNNTMLYQWWTAHLRNDQITRIAIKLYGKASVLGRDYDFTIIEVAEEASIRILGATIAYGYYLPIL